MIVLNDDDVRAARGWIKAVDHNRDRVGFTAHHGPIACIAADHVTWLIAHIDKMNDFIRRIEHEADERAATAYTRGVKSVAPDLSPAVLDAALEYARASIEAHHASRASGEWHETHLRSYGVRERFAHECKIAAESAVATERAKGGAE